MSRRSEARQTANRTSTRERQRVSVPPATVQEKVAAPQGALSALRIYLRNQDGEPLILRPDGLEVTREPVLHRGRMEILPRKGEFILSHDLSKSFEVLSVGHVLPRTTGKPHRVIISIQIPPSSTK